MGSGSSVSFIDSSNFDEMVRELSFCSPSSTTGSSVSDVGSRNFDEIVEHAIVLVRHERWRIKNTIRSNLKANEETKSIFLLDDELFGEHLDALTKALRTELDVDKSDPPRKKRKVQEMTVREGVTFDTLRRGHHEVMMRVYSFLPLRDRICTLSLVDRAFSQDLIRGGVVCANYGPGFNLQQALLEFEHGFIRSKKSGVMYGHISEDTSPSEISEMVERMLENAGIADGEELLFTKSNLVNTITTGEDRKRRVTFHANRFIHREKDRLQKLSRYQEYSWLEETVLVQKFLKHYFFDTYFDRLRRLMRDQSKDAHAYLERYRVYECMPTTILGYNDRELLFPVPGISPGCALMLLDPDNAGGWKEHRLVTCYSCSKRFWDSNNAIVNETGHFYYMCDICHDICQSVHSQAQSAFSSMVSIRF